MLRTIECSNPLKFKFHSGFFKMKIVLWSFYLNSVELKIILRKGIFHAYYNIELLSLQKLDISFFFLNRNYHVYIYFYFFIFLQLLLFKMKLKLIGFNIQSKNLIACEFLRIQTYTQKMIHPNNEIWDKNVLE